MLCQTAKQIEVERTSLRSVGIAGIRHYDPERSKESPGYFWYMHGKLFDNGNFAGGILEGGTGIQDPTSVPFYSGYFRNKL